MDDTTIQIAGFLPNSTVNGPGMRSVIFMSGCYHNCPGCHNKEMQDINYGERVSISSIVNDVLKNRALIDGVTISGGEPFCQLYELYQLCNQLKSLGFNIWVYTGYKLENLNASCILENADVLVDGKYIEGCTDDKSKYVGSSNQRIWSISKVSNKLNFKQIKL